MARRWVSTATSVCTRDTDMQHRLLPSRLAGTSTATETAQITPQRRNRRMAAHGYVYVLGCTCVLLTMCGEAHIEQQDIRRRTQCASEQIMPAWTSVFGW